MMVENAASGRKQRLLFCAHDLENGGSPRSLAILVEFLARRYSLAIVALREPHPRNPLAVRYLELGVPVFVFPWGWLPLSYVNCPVNASLHKSRCERMRPFIPRLRWLAQGADHICFNGYPATSLASLLPASVPKTLIAREVLDKSDPGYARACGYLRSSISKAVAIGPMEKAQLDAIGIASAIVYNSSPRKPEFMPVPEDGRLHFGAFSRFGPGKGLDILGAAVAKAAPELRAARAVVHIFGATGSPANELETALRKFIGRNNLADVLVLEDWVADVEKAMAGVHCVVRPDFSGSPWGRDIVEAMSLGRPVLATGSLDVFVKQERTGWLVPPGDIGAMAAALKKIAGSTAELAAIGANAFRFAAENFDPETNSAKIEKLLFCGSNTVDWE